MAERIAQEAQGQKEKKGTPGKEATLAAIAKSAEFTAILNEEARFRGLKPEKIRSCVCSLYGKLSAHAHGVEQPVVIGNMNLSPNERAALIVLLKLQDKWPKPLSWREEEEEEEEEKS